MPGKTDYLENKLLAHVLCGVTYTSPASIFIGLFTATAGEATAGTEVSGNNYARAGGTFVPPTANSPGYTHNSVAVTFQTPSADWGTITSWGAFDHASAGTLLYFANLAANKTIQSGDGVQFPIASLVVNEE